MADHGRLDHPAHRFTVCPDDVERAEGWLKRHGGPALLFGRLVPAVRSVISMPAGFARMPVLSVLLWSATGTLLWTSVLAGLGYVLVGQYESIAEKVDLATKVVLGILLAMYVWRVVKFRRRQPQG